MKRFDRLIIAVVAVMLVIIAVVNAVLLRPSDKAEDIHKVELNRVRQQLTSGEQIDVGTYDTITGVYGFEPNSDEIYETKSEYIIVRVGERVYRIEYDDSNDNIYTDAIAAVNIGFAVIFAFVLILLLYLRNNMLRPFNKLSELPYELSKGNLTEPLKEEQSRYFGKFVWGLDLLREKLEHSKQAELEHAKAEKTMILSLSHDIKTPLSAIKLYSKALSMGLYTDPEKLAEVYAGISGNADEIEHYLEEIIKRSSDSFMSFETVNRDIYMDEVLSGIEEYYREKLSITGTEFHIAEHSNCLINADPDRLAEVLQNIIENAVKYGDGKSISLSFSDEENCRLITVSNSGCELSENELDHIFDSFWRGSNSTGKPGSGLGLYICRRLMNCMGGDIFAEAKCG
ncbi:MAG: HAMP domain-containing histidine kinase, partial [Ruminococcus sp.]|nr:HAMP domain-containing histidine kinase [Ruminococcus sp.]